MKNQLLIDISTSTSKIRSTGITLALMLSVLTVSAQELTSLLTVHRPFRIGFTGGGHTHQPALQGNILYSLGQHTTTYYEGTLDQVGEQWNEVGVVQSLINRPTDKSLAGPLAGSSISGYVIGFSGQQGELIGVLGLQAATSSDYTHQWAAEYYSIWDRNDISGMAHFAGMWYTLQQKNISLTLKQSLLGTTSFEDQSPASEHDQGRHDIVSFPSKAVIRYDGKDFSLFLTSIYNILNQEEPVMVSLSMRKVL